MSTLTPPGTNPPATTRDRSTPFVITIDGPAASGKSSVARGVADALAVPFVSSGLLYRAATYLVLLGGADPADERAVLGCLGAHQVVLKALPIEPNRVVIDNQDASAALHTDDVDASVSAVALHPGVRTWVMNRLREVEGSFVVEGRDMGRAVFPEAEHKFYLSAPPEVRAKRRVGERRAGLERVAEALLRRDRLDARQLEPAPDAVFVETGPLDVAGVVAHILERVRAAQPR